MEATIMEHGKLLDDIHGDAAGEAKKIAAETERSLEERKNLYERQLAEIAAEAKKTAADRTVALKKNLTAGLAVELRKISLHARDRIFKKILERVEEKFYKKIGQKDYPGVLLGWIVEAAIGLGSGRAVLGASLEEQPLIDDKLLKKAEETVKLLVHKEISIRKSEAPFLLQGIILSSEDGKTAFNNQVRTRLIRNQSMIRKIIYDRLLKDGGEET